MIRSLARSAVILFTPAVMLAALVALFGPTSSAHASEPARPQPVTTLLPDSAIAATTPMVRVRGSIGPTWPA